MLEKLNVRRIVSDHFSTLKYHDTNRYSAADFVVLFGVPAVLPSLMVWKAWFPSHGLIEVVVTAVSIVTGLLFNLLVLLYEQVGRPASSADKGRKPKTRRRLLRETYQNVSFCILALLGSLVFLLGAHLSFEVVVHLAAPLAAYMVGVGFLTLLMILKRVHALLTNEFEEEEERGEEKPRPGGQGPAEIADS